MLLLASSSTSRQKLLQEAQIPCMVIQQNADECSISWEGSPEEVAQRIALLKMEHVIIPAHSTGTIYILTADTITVTQDGIIMGKPTSREEAVGMIRSLRAHARVVTAFCLEVRTKKGDNWMVTKRITNTVSSTCNFDLPDNWVNTYLDQIDYRACTGALAVDGYGSLFVCSIQGSYTNIIGLPMAELRRALLDAGFFDSFLNGQGDSSACDNRS